MQRPVTMVVDVAEALEEITVYLQSHHPSFLPFLNVDVIKAAFLKAMAETTLMFDINRTTYGIPFFEQQRENVIDSIQMFFHELAFDYFNGEALHKLRVMRWTVPTFVEYHQGGFIVLSFEGEQ